MAIFPPKGVPLRMPEPGEILLPDPTIARKFVADLRYDTQAAIALTSAISPEQWQPIAERLIELLNEDADARAITVRPWWNPNGSVPPTVVAAVILGIAYARLDVRYGKRRSYCDARIHTGMIIASYNIPDDVGLKWVGGYLILGAYYLRRME